MAPVDLLGNLISDIILSMGYTVVGLAPVVKLPRRDCTMLLVSTERKVRTQLLVVTFKDVFCIA